MSEVFRHDDYVNVDVAKTGDKSVAAFNVIKALKVLHVFLLYTKVSASHNII